MLESSCEQLEAFLADDMPAAERSAFEAHLGHCTSCTEAVYSEARLHDLMAEAAGRTLIDRTALVRGIERRIHRARRTRSALWGSGVLAIVTVAVALPLAWRSVFQPTPTAITKQTQTPDDDDTARIKKVSDEPIVRITPQNTKDTLIVGMPSTNPDVTIVWVYSAIRVEDD